MTQNWVGKSLFCLNATPIATGLDLDGGFRELSGERRVAHTETAASALELRDLAVDVAHAHCSFAARRSVRGPGSDSPLAVVAFRREAHARYTNLLHVEHLHEKGTSG